MHINLKFIPMHWISLYAFSIDSYPPTSNATTQPLSWTKKSWWWAENEWLREAQLCALLEKATNCNSACVCAHVRFWVWLCIDALLYKINYWGLLLRPIHPPLCKWWNCISPTTKNKIFNRSSNFPWVLRAADDKLMTLSLYEGPLAKQEKSFEIHAIYWGF